MVSAGTIAGQGVAGSTRKEWRELIRLWVPYVLIMPILWIVIITHSSNLGVFDCYCDNSKTDEKDKVFKKETCYSQLIDFFIEGDRNNETFPIVSISS